MIKVCFKCNIEKTLSEYYKHPKMADGHLNKCKDCTRADIKKRADILSESDEWMESERKRGREKYRRLYIGTGKAKPEYNKRWEEKYPEKKLAKIASGNMIKPYENAEKHHWSYNEEHYKDVIWLTKKEHMKAHRFIIYDPERFMYRRYDNMELLDTRERHEQFIRMCIETKED